jgi:ABC-type Fe3+ transport system substrate-binding protein
VVLGCAQQGIEPLRLVLISPHRDEIREEVAIAFPEWFRERTASRIARAEASLHDWLAHPGPQTKTAAEQACSALLGDWATDDQGGLGAASRQWQHEPSADRAQAILTELAGWRESRPPVELVWQDIGGGTAQIARYVAARFDANPNGIGIDLLFGGGTDIYLRFAPLGMLEKIDVPPELLGKRIPPEVHGIPLYDREGRWFGPMLTSFGILANREVLRRIGQAEPQHWADLGAPGLFSWVSAGDPRMTGSVHMVYEIILQGHGWEEGIGQLLRMGANTHTFIRDSGTLTRTVVNGEVAAAGNLDSNALTAVAREPQTMAFCLPAGETILNPDAIGVLRGAPHRELARAFVEFTLSDAGQLIFLLRPGEPGGPRRYPLCRLSVVEELYARYPPEARSVGAANPFAVGTTIHYDSRLGNSRWDALNDLFGAAIMDAHADLSAAWRAVLAVSDPEARRRLEGKLFAPPCTHEELLAHARATAEGGPRARTLTINRWGEEARQRYRGVRTEAESYNKRS